MDTNYLLFMFQHRQTIQNMKKYRMQTELTPKGTSAPAKGRWGRTTQWLRSEGEESETAVGDNHCKFLVL